MSISKTSFQNHLKQFPRKTCQVTRPSFEITQTNFIEKHAKWQNWVSKFLLENYSYLENIFKISFPPWFYKKHFYFKSYYFQFHVFL